MLVVNAMLRLQRAHNVIWSLHFYVVTTLHSQRCHNQNTTLSQRCHNVILFAGHIYDRDFFFETCILHVLTKGSVSQNLYLGLSFLFYV